MSNLDVYLPAVNGKEYWIHESGESCKNAIHTLLTDDFAAPPKNMIIQVKTASGKIVKVIIPYSHKELAYVQVDDEEI